MFERTQVLTKKTKQPFLPLVYICSPYSGNIEKNTIAARAYSRFAIDNSAIPLTPHLLYPQFMNDGDPNERELALFFNKVLQGKCQEVWIFGSHLSEGMAAEIALAELRHQRIRYFDAGCKEVFK